MGGGLQIFFFIGVLEFGLLKQDGKRAPGDFANIGFLGIPYAEGIQDAAARTRSLNSELANGRLAMLAILGMLVQNGTFGTTGPQMWLPASAFETELGAQAPFGFWDPAGLVREGDAALFYKYRVAEIKHGRVAMIAAMGFIAPEAGPKFAGYISPSTGVKFEDIPNGLAALGPSRYLKT